ncbi:MerR family transcriptional regulator [Paenibacillus turpanensis]|uniref:MerR family transcriptional regulator n=1 Tax=Paenibacillus turpanensis TaxID=2689078 RepID=UPI00140C077F|nr:MerR family transcriptional regulator [Paenibacillus turpanensis]
MEQAMTIQLFSDRTGLPASTLRYYEKEGLIRPHVRGENGYRLYTEEQIPIALTIHSLRLADVSLRDIREYLGSSSAERKGWLIKWREEIDSKITSLHISRQYLYGIDAADDQAVRLVKWEQPVPFLWYPVTVKRQLHPYNEAVRATSAAFQGRFGVQPSEAYVRTDSADRTTMTGWIGYRLPKGRAAECHGEQVRMTDHAPTLFVTLDCMVSDEFVCFNLMLLLQKFGFEPAGPKLERYSLKDLSQYQWMIPVQHMQSRDV